MATYSTTAESVINSVIQDGQVQTTNRTNLLGYVNRVSLRLLRETQWLFLKSEEQRFITQPDAMSYWLGTSGGVPPGCVNTGLNLSDVYSIIPDSVYDLSNGRRLTQDADSILVGQILRFRDANFRSSNPRSYSYDYGVPGVLNLVPPPDNENNYQPIPSSPICNWTTGGTLPQRNYYILVTLVDSSGGESVACYQYSNILVPVYSLLTVQSPTVDVMSSSTVSYSYYNIYVSTTSNGTFYKQNGVPIPQGQTWTEPLTGVSSHAPVTNQFTLVSSGGFCFSVGIHTTGQLFETPSEGAANLVYLSDTSGNKYLLGINDIGQLTTTAATPYAYQQAVLADSSGQYWALSVDSAGHLVTTQTAVTAIPVTPPQTSTIAPIQGYVISFHYQKKHIQIADSSDVLQIPDDYSDVVIAGVNYYANLYTSKSDDLGVKVAVWKKEFLDGMAQMRRDLRINFRNTDYIMPDPSTQYYPGIQYGYNSYSS